MVKEWKEPFCVMCGRTRGTKNVYLVPEKPWMGVTDVENRWEATQEFTGAKPFGVVKSSGGRGTLQMVRYYDIDEDTEGYLPLMKSRLLAIMGEWLEKGWVTRDELLGAMSG